MNDSVSRHTTANNGLKRGLLAVRNDLRLDLTVALQQSEDDSLTTRCSATTLAAHACRAEVRFINFDFTVFERRLALTFFGDAAADFAKDRDD